MDRAEAETNLMKAIFDYAMKFDWTARGDEEEAIKDRAPDDNNEWFLDSAIVCASFTANGKDGERIDMNFFGSAPEDTSDEKRIGLAWKLWKRFSE